jgi:hypothetical protein
MIKKFWEIWGETKEIGKEPFEHGIFFISETEIENLPSIIFNNNEIAQRIRLLEQIYKTNKFLVAKQILADFALKRIVISKSFEENLTYGLQLALFYLLEFKSKIPFEMINNVYQEDIDKGNHLVLIIDKEKVEAYPFITFLTWVLATLYKSILNASDFNLKPSLESIINYIITKCNFKEIKHYQAIKELVEIIYRRYNIEIIDKNSRQSLIPEIILLIINSFSFYYDEIIKIISSYNEFEWLNIIINKYLYLLNNLNFYKEKENIIFLLRIPMQNNIAQINQIEDLETVILDPKLYKNFSKTNFAGWDIKNNKLLPILPKVGNINKETSKQYKIFLFKKTLNSEEEFTFLVPSKLYKDEKAILIYPSYLFRCEKCFDIDNSNHCNICNREKRIIAICVECKNTRIGIDNKCLVCGGRIHTLYYVKINLQHELNDYSKRLNIEKEKILELLINSNYKKELYLLENLAKGYIRNKYGLKVDSTGACKITVNVATSLNEKIIEEDEIILPNHVLGKLKSIREYILELKREIYKQNIKRKDEPFLLLITVQDNLLYYLVKIKGSSENDFAIIHPKLYAKVTPHLNPNNKIHIYLLEDFLLNYSKFYSENTQVPVFLVLNENKSGQISKTDLKLDIPFEENTETQFRELALYSIKLTLLNQIIEKAIANVRIGLKCENCDKEYTRMPVFTRCKKCRKKLRYKWNKGPLIPYIKEIEKQTQTFNLFPYIKKIRRPVIRFVEGYFKDYDAYEKLDKFL